MKSRLIRLMTHLDTDLKHCAADFIFVLCKENGKDKQGKSDECVLEATPVPSLHFL